MREHYLSGERRIVQRRYAPKTRTGCKTCKIRRVKCDEAKPSCNRCTSTGRKCDGYSSESPPETQNQCSRMSIQSSLTIDVSCDALEKRTFDFFRAKTVPCVSGYFQDSVWDRMILQVSHSEPAVRHAINALAAQHEENILRQSIIMSGSASPTDCRTSFPVQQYSRALIGMRKLLSAENVSMNLVLMCSIACIHFEALRESFVPALIHAENAIGLLHSKTMFDAKKIDPDLVRAMMRIDVQGATYLGMRVPGLPFYTSESDSALPTAFHDLSQARHLVETWTSRMFHFMRTEADEYKFRGPCVAPLETIAKGHSLERTFGHIDGLLLEFVNRPNVRLTAREHHGLDLLRCRVKMNIVLSACCLYSEASMHDAFSEQFEEVLAICTYVLRSDDPDRRLLAVSLDEGLLMPLWFVATHCRDSCTRRKALQLLKTLPAGKRVWHIEAMIRSAELLINVEEAGTEKEHPTYTDIPEWRRIHSAGLDGVGISTTKQTLNVYLRSRPNGMDGEWVEMQQTIECWSNTSDEIDLKPCEIPASEFTILGTRRSDYGGCAREVEAMYTPWMASAPFRLWLKNTAAH